jgi:SHS2 domain-containing protein
MTYRFLDSVAIADVAFEATGEDLSELFSAAGDATISTMVASLDGILAKTSRKIEISNAELDLLLFDFLQELIYYKDADGLLLRVTEVDIGEQRDGFKLTANGTGEEIDPSRHEQRADVKAVTLHKFKVEETSEGWRCFVILDV